jgi:hypothetical protein
MFTVAVALALFTAPILSDAQQPGKVYRIGILGGNMFAPTEDTPPPNAPSRAVLTGRHGWRGCGSTAISRVRTWSSSTGGMGGGTTAPPPSQPSL